MTGTGRPSKLTEEIKLQIFECLIVKDMTIKQTAKDCGLSEGTIYKWFNEDEEFMKFSQRVREVKAHKIINRAEHAIQEIDNIDTSKEDKQSVDLDFKKARIVFDSYLRLAGKYNRKTYGEKLDTDITTNGKEIKAIAIVPNKLEADKWGK